MRVSWKIRWNSELVISILFFGPQINYYIAALLSVNGLPTITIYVYAALFGLGALSYIFTLRRKEALVSFMIFTLITVFSLTINSDIQKYMFGASVFTSPILILALIYFPVLMLTIDSVNISNLVMYFRRFSAVTLIIALFAFCNYLFVHGTNPPDYMTFAYMILTPTMVCFMDEPNKNWFIKALSLLGSFIILIVGCRGALLALVVFYLLYIIGFYTTKGGKRHTAVKIILIIAIIAFAINIDNVFNLIDGALQAIGFRSRTLNNFLYGGVASLEGDGRWSIWKQALDNITILGKGLFGDRTVIINEYGQNVYAHNILLELLVDFGAVFGLVFILVFIGIIIKASTVIKASGNKLYLKVNYAFIAILMVKHMVSASFLTSFDFWLYFGLAVHFTINNQDYLRLSDSKDGE